MTKIRENILSHQILGTGIEMGHKFDKLEGKGISQVELALSCQFT